MADIRHMIQTGGPREKVYSLVSTIKGLSEWWAADVSEGADGTVELGFFNKATVYRLRRVATEGTQLCEWICESGKEWEGTRLTFLLEDASGGGTVVRFAHARWRAETDYFTSCNTTWGELMFRLKTAAEGKAPGPLFLAASLAY